MRALTTRSDLLTRRELLAAVRPGPRRAGPRRACWRRRRRGGRTRWRPKPPHFPAKAKRVIHFFLNGGPSHVDTFDPKPALAKYAGKPLPGRTCRTERKTGAALPVAVQVPEVRPERHRGQRALRRTSPSTSTTSASIRSMHADVPNHEPSLMLMNCGDSAAAAAERRLLGAVRPGHREPEPARLHRHVPRRLPDQGRRELAVRLPARRRTRARTSTRSTRDVDKLIENIRNPHADRGRRSAGSSTCCARSTREHLRRARRDDRSSRPASSRSSWPSACRPRRPTRSTSPASRSTSASCTAPASTAGRLLIARRLLERGVRVRAALARRRPAVGQPRQHRSEPPQARRRDRPADRRAADRPEAARACSTTRW